MMLATDKDVFAEGRGMVQRQRRALRRDGDGLRCSMANGKRGKGYCDVARGWI